MTPLYLTGMEFNIDNIFMAVATSKGMLSGGMKAPFAVLHQKHKRRGEQARIMSVGLSRTAMFVGITLKELQRDTNYTNPNPNWGLVGVELPETWVRSQQRS